MTCKGRRAQDIRQPPRGNRQRDSGGNVAVHGLGSLARDELRKVLPGDAQENSGAASQESRRSDCGILNRLPRHFEHQALLRVHRPRFTRQDAEELRIEFIHPIQEPAPPRAHLPIYGWVRIIIRVAIPAVGGDVDDRIGPAAQKLPEPLRVIGPARKPAAHSNHRDRLISDALELVNLGLQLKHQSASRLGESLEIRSKNSLI